MENMVNIINIDHKSDNTFLGYKRPLDADAEIISLDLLGGYVPTCRSHKQYLAVAGAKGKGI